MMHQKWLCDFDIKNLWDIKLKSHAPFFFSLGGMCEKAAGEKRGAIYSSMSSVLAKIHSIDFNVEELRDYGKTDGKYLRRNLARWAGQVKAG